MTSLSPALGALLFGLAGAGVIYTLIASVLVRRFFRAPSALAIQDQGSGEGATILKPLHGAEPALRDNLQSFFQQVDAEPMQIVFGVHGPNDPARAVAEGLIGQHPNVQAQVHVDTREHGQNGKISNLINMMDQVRHPMIVLSDSDIAVQPDYLRRVEAALRTPGVGVVTCPYIGAAEGGMWSKIAAMGLDYQFFSNVIMGVGLGMAAPCMGSTIALRRETLDRIGGFEALKDTLADDYAIGRRVRRLGLKSMVAPVLVSHSCFETRLSEVFSHELRWAKTIKGVNPSGHAGSVVTHPLPIAVLAALFLGFSLPALMLLGAAFLARVWLMRTVDQVIGRKMGSWWLIPLRDVLSFCVFVSSFFVRSVEWRGVKFHVSQDGDLKPV